MLEATLAGLAGRRPGHESTKGSRGRNGKTAWRELEATRSLLRHELLVIDREMPEALEALRLSLALSERTVDWHNVRLLLPKITFDGWWKSLGEVTCADATVIALYCDHATSEQFHSEFKTDLEIERLPSGKFANNDLVMAWAVLTYNILAGSGSSVSCAMMRRSGTRPSAGA
jgi:hypothetical protein